LALSDSQQTPDARAGAPAASRRPLWLLLLGTLLGLGMSIYGLLQPGAAGQGGLPDGTIARVNATPILTEHYFRLLGALETDLKRPANEEERIRVLDRIIEEELLVQRGLEFGLARYDRRVRSDLVSAVIASVTAEAEERQPREGELREFFEKHRDFFTQPGRLRIRQIFVSGAKGDEGAARARRAFERLEAGEPFLQVRAELGDLELAPVPDALLPPVKLREYLGPTALRSAMSLGLGQLGRPVRSGTGWHVIQLVEREVQRVPAFEEVEAQVRSEWTRRLGDQALRDYLDELRSRADVELAEALP
jgi:parvulin-like peptidyl-prolyl isomerase